MHKSQAYIDKYLANPPRPLFLRACRSWAQPRSPTNPGEGFTLTLPFPTGLSRWLLRAPKRTKRILSAQNEWFQNCIMSKWSFCVDRIATLGDSWPRQFASISIFGGDEVTLSSAQLKNCDYAVVVILPRYNAIFWSGRTNLFAAQNGSGAFCSHRMNGFKTACFVFGPIKNCDYAIVAILPV